MRSTAPYFSIVIPTYNRARFVSRTLNSCLNQDYGNFEIVVVDDASTDDSVAIVERAADAASVPLLLIKKRSNTGLADARNLGLERARGRSVRAAT